LEAVGEATGAGVIFRFGIYVIQVQRTQKIVVRPSTQLNKSRNLIAAEDEK